MIKAYLENSIYFKDEEKVFAFSLLSKVFLEMSNKSTFQKKFLTYVGEYLNVFEPQLDVSFDKVDNIEKSEVQEFIFYMIYQLLYLEDDSFGFEEQDEFVDALDNFSIKRSMIKEIKQNLLGFYDIEQYFEELLTNKSELITADMLLDEVEFMLSQRLNTDSRFSPPHFDSKRDFEALFEMECRGKANGYFESAALDIINKYISSLEEVDLYIKNNYISEEDCIIETIIDEFKILSISDSKNHDYEIEYDRYSSFGFKTSCLNMSTGKSSYRWELDSRHYDVLCHEVYEIMKRIEALIYEKYKASLRELVDYYSLNYELVKTPDNTFNLKEKLASISNLEDRMLVVEELRDSMDYQEFKTSLEDIYIKDLPLLLAADDYSFIDYLKGHLLFTASFNKGDGLNPDVNIKFCVVDLMKNVEELADIDCQTGYTMIFPSSVCCIDKIYFLATNLHQTEDNYSILLQYESSTKTISNVFSNGERVAFFDDMHWIVGCRYVNAEFGDLFVGYTNFAGIKQKEIVLENMYEYINGDHKDYIEDSVLIDSFLLLQDNCYGMLESEVNKGNALAMYLLGELEYHDNRTKRGRSEEKAIDLWSRGRKDNWLCKARDLLNNSARYSDEEKKTIVDKIYCKKDENSLYSYIYYLFLINQYYGEKTEEEINALLIKEINKGNWIACHSFTLKLIRNKEVEKALEYIIKCIDMGVYNTVDELFNIYFNWSHFTEDKYTSLKLLLSKYPSVVDVKKMKEELKNLDDLIPSIHLMDLDRDRSTYEMDCLKKFSSKSAAQSYAEKQYGKYCEFIKDTFRLNCVYYSGQNNNFESFILSNCKRIYEVVRNIQICRAFNQSEFMDIKLERLYDSVRNGIVSLGEEIDVSNFYATNYLTHDFTEWSEGGFFSKKEYSNFPSTNGLERDFSDKKEEFSNRVRKMVLMLLHATFDDIIKEL